MKLKYIILLFGKIHDLIKSNLGNGNLLNMMSCEKTVT